MYIGIIKHKVRNFAAWKRAYDAHAERRIAAGMSNGRVLRIADAPNDVVIILEVADGRKFKRFVASADLRTTMKRAGVVGRPTVLLCRSPSSHPSKRHEAARALEVEAHPS